MSLVRESPKIAEQRSGVGDQLRQHPRHREQQRGEKRQQSRHGGKTRILNRGKNLRQAHNDSDHESDGKNRQSQPERRHKRGSQQIDNRGGGHLQLRLLTSDPITRFHPSTSTNNKILNGAETITGGSCTMPTESVIEATTRSMIRNGRNSTAPISNDAFSSLIT